jgi:hypothetical protein
MGGIGSPYRLLEENRLERPLGNRDEEENIGIYPVEVGFSNSGWI